MNLEQSFTVQAPVPEVWAALIDVQRVAPCLPGAEITEAAQDGSFKGAFTVRLGPTTANYNGTLKLESLDEDAHVATMSARGTDRRGKGGASATIVSTLHEEHEGTRVDVVTDFAITGRLASFGRGGMIQDISNRLLREFAACLQETLASGPAPAVDRGEPDAPAADAVAEAAVASSPGAGGADVPPVAPPAPVATDAAAPAPPRPPGPATKPVSGLRLVLGALLDGMKRRLARRRRTR